MLIKYVTIKSYIAYKPNNPNNIINTIILYISNRPIIFELTITTNGNN